MANGRQIANSAYLNGRTTETLRKQLAARLLSVQDTVRGGNPGNDFLETFASRADRIADEIQGRESL